MNKTLKTLSALKNDIMPVLNNTVHSLNNSKFFAGIVMLLLNIGARHMSIKLSKTQEDLLKYDVARELVIFAMAWIATREILTSLYITAAFVILADYLFNEESKMCIIPQHLLDYHKMRNERLGGDAVITPEDERKALETLEKARKQKDVDAQVKFLNMLQTSSPSAY